jgi:branched-chain amino acid transport system permease protein
MEFVIAQTFNGLSYAALIFLLGGGMTLIFGVMKIVNIAQGSFYLVGGYIGYIIVRYTGNFYLAIFGSCVALAFIGMTLERYFLRGLEGDDLRQMLMTMGIALFFQDLLLVIFEGYPLSLTPPAFCALKLKIGHFSLHVLRLFMIGAAALTYLILWWFQEKTRAGAILRAAVDNKEIAQGLGINVPFVTMGVFGLGALLAAFAGVIGCAFTAIYPGLDFEVLPLAFVVVIIGGMGSLKGALIGALVVGLIDNFGRAIFPELSYFTLFAPMAAILAVRPTGLFGRE